VAAGPPSLGWPADEPSLGSSSLEECFAAGSYVALAQPSPSGVAHHIALESTNQPTRDPCARACARSFELGITPNRTADDIES
jgi:hypothetical protein